jgi:tRNA threonylcarbamoyladenosine biosynthesis protein TsaE
MKTATPKLQLNSESAEATRNIGAALGVLLSPPCAIALDGELGVGKTTFVQGLAGSLGVEEISSPSYTLVNEYIGQIPLFHFDFYRLHDAAELIDICFFDHIASKDAIVIVEWAQKFSDSLPEATIYVHIEYNDEPGQKRTLSLWTEDSKMQHVMDQLVQSINAAVRET